MKCFVWKPDKDGKLNGDVIDGILSREKKEVDKVIISAAKLNKYFGKDATPREMKDQIMSLLDAWKKKQPPERTAPKKKTDRESRIWSENRQGGGIVNTCPAVLF